MCCILNIGLMWSTLTVFVMLATVGTYSVLWLVPSIRMMVVFSSVASHFGVPQKLAYCPSLKWMKNKTFLFSFSWAHNLMSPCIACLWRALAMAQVVVVLLPCILSSVYSDEYLTVSIWFKNMYLGLYNNWNVLHTLVEIYYCNDILPHQAEPIIYKILLGSPPK